MAAQTEQWWSTEDLANYMGISPSTVRRKASTGQWPCHKIGKLYRFTDDNVETIREQTKVETDYFYDRDRVARLLRKSA